MYAFMSLRWGSHIVSILSIFSLPLARSLHMSVCIYVRRTSNYSSSINMLNWARVAPFNLTENIFLYKIKKRGRHTTKAALNYIGWREGGVTS